mmetsp:Transcript_40435/g.112307  ORF Transcript_40435/g.112307 Transcript_40435/m.112307 type:complete len:660 (-) Transcript_40435:119-2098(-)
MAHLSEKALFVLAVLPLGLWAHRSAEVQRVLSRLEGGSHSGDVRLVESPKPKDNPCKGRQGSDCRARAQECTWDGVSTCRPKSCDGIKGSDCRDLAPQCTWKWDEASKIGVCLDKLSSAPTIGPTALRDNPCKGLKGSTCRAEKQDCAWDWDQQTRAGTCRPQSCAGIKGSDCRDLALQCTWKWDVTTKTGECLDQPSGIATMPSTTTSTTTASPAPRHKDNICKGLKGSECRAREPECRWDWDGQTKTGACRPESCVGIKGSDCRDLSVTIFRAGSSAVEKDNPCKVLEYSECKALEQDCTWDWIDKESNMGDCRPKTCTGIKGSDCKDLPVQCTWTWDEESETGRCLDQPAYATPSTAPSTTVPRVEEPPATKLKDNLCKNLIATDCLARQRDCEWNSVSFDFCRPKSCIGIKGSDCKDLPLQCTWKWNQTTKTGACLDQPSATTPTTTSTIVAPSGDAPATKLRANPCKGIGGSDCKARAQECMWDWDEQSNTGDCRPTSCAGIEGSDCSDLLTQCLWKWDPDTDSGECLDQPPVAAPSAHLRDNPCRGLKGSECRARDRECRWDWDTQTSTGTCRPTSCIGVKGSDCRLLPGQCTWKWDPATKIGECLDGPSTPATSTTTSTAASTSTTSIAVGRVRSPALLVYGLACTTLCVVL